MKKVIQILTAAVLVLALSPLSSLANSANPAPKGFYSVKAGSEQYYTVEQFKQLSKQEKKNVMKNDWYIVTNGTVFPVLSLLLPTNQLMGSAIKEDKFEKDNNVDLGSIADGSGGTTDKDFEVEDIE